ncbi:glycosyltransferase family 2 protein [Pantoea sp. CTOTU50773]|uniref:glycosyltransferase family 2 protein n=1 Tax=Pantoea sp. CTOTU50773 TaxID=2953853 RepID=UPI0028ACEEBF|nr:glycosyltransferase family 2 protein [Pantoea sp. CTOTU50773]
MERLKMKTAVCSICRNESPYIFEWIAYQKKIGFDQVFIYDNHSEDGTSELLIKLDHAGIIRRIFWPRLENIAPQRSAYADFLEKYAADFDWTFICDLDEFLHIENKDLKTFIGDALRKQPTAAAIAIPWLMFGSSGNEEYVDELVTQRFTHCDDNVTSRVKTLFRPSSAYQIRTHIVDLHTGIYLDNNFDEAKWSGAMPICLEKPSSGRAQLHHYFTKSRFEWNKRKSQAKADRAHIEFADIQLFEKYNNQTNKNFKLSEGSDELKRYVLDIKHRINLKSKNSISANIIFSNETLLIIRVSSEIAISKLRLVIDDKLEIITSNLMTLHDGSIAFFLNVKTKHKIADNIKVSSIDNSNIVSINVRDMPTRMEMLNNVLNFLPNSEYIKFNIFKRIANDPKRLKHLNTYEFGDFNKFSEYKGMINIHRLYVNSKLTQEDITSYLNTHGSAGQKLMDEFFDIEGPFSESLNETMRKC